MIVIEAFDGKVRVVDFNQNLIEKFDSVEQAEEKLGSKIKAKYLFGMNPPTRNLSYLVSKFSKQFYEV